MDGHETQESGAGPLKNEGTSECGWKDWSLYDIVSWIAASLYDVNRKLEKIMSTQATELAALNTISASIDQLVAGIGNIATELTTAANEVSTLVTDLTNTGFPQNIVDATTALAAKVTNAATALGTVANDAQALVSAAVPPATPDTPPAA